MRRAVGYSSSVMCDVASFRTWLLWTTCCLPLTGLCLTSASIELSMPTGRLYWMHWAAILAFIPLVLDVDSKLRLVSHELFIFICKLKAIEKLYISFILNPTVKFQIFCLPTELQWQSYFEVLLINNISTWPDYLGLRLNVVLTELLGRRLWAWWRAVEHYLLAFETATAYSGNIHSSTGTNRLRASSEDGEQARRGAHQLHAQQSGGGISPATDEHHATGLATARGTALEDTVFESFVRGTFWIRKIFRFVSVGKLYICRFVASGRFYDSTSHQSPYKLQQFILLLFLHHRPTIPTYLGKSRLSRNFTFMVSRSVPTLDWLKPLHPYPSPSTFLSHTLMP